MTSLEGEPQFQRLRQWFQGLGGAMHESVQIYRDPVSGTSLRAKPGQAAPVDGLIVSCPLAASLSYLNAVAGGPCFGGAEASSEKSSAPNPAFPQAFMDAVPPHVIGRFFLVQQFLLGPASHWYPYIATLPRPDDFGSWGLPAVWRARSDTDAAAKAASDLLRGTNAEVAAQTMADLITSEYSHAVAHLAQMPNASEYTRVLYEWAYCMFTSRSFRPSLVLPEGGGGGGGETGGAEEADNFSVLLPVLDLGNHAPAARVSWERQTQPHISVDFWALDTYAPGSQIYNNYGSKTNSELLVGYGFVLPPTPQLHNDYVHLRRMGGAPGSELMPQSASGDTKPGHTGAPPPPSFLLGLRAMADTSSVVGRGRAQLTAGRARLPEFARFEDGLLWDMLIRLCSVEDREQLTRYAATKFGVTAKDAPIEAVYAAAPVAQLQAAIMDMVFSEEEEDDDDDEKEQFGLEKADAVRQTLTYKMYTDCKVLRMTDAKSTGGSGGSGGSGFERLAAQYRGQYRGVLEAAFKELSGEDYESSDDEE